MYWFSIVINKYYYLDRMESPLDNIVFATLVQQIWWVAMWGILYLGVEYISQGSKALELKIYIVLLVIVWITLVCYPQLHKHF